MTYIARNRIKQPLNTKLLFHKKLITNPFP